jgi:hypothetical protein
MYSKVDEITYGRCTWTSSDITYTGEDRHDPGAASWKRAAYTVFARDTHEALTSQLASSDFDGHYDYLAHQDFEEMPDGSRQRKFANLMSGDWAWKKLVSECSAVYIEHQLMIIL